MASGSSRRSLAAPRRGSRVALAGKKSKAVRGAPISSSMETRSPAATPLSTEEVGFALPVSRLAQVPRGMPASGLMRCCESPRSSRRRRRGQGSR